MRRLLVTAALAALVGCEGSSEADARDCFSIQDCADNETCFYGRCVEAGFGLTEVYAELAPPNDSPWLEQQVPYVLDLRGFQDISVRASLLFSGIVRPSTRGSEGLPGVLVARATAEGIPGRSIVRQANVTASGFELEVLPGEIELSFEPSAADKPPRSYWVDVTENRDQVLPYWSNADLLASTFHGRILQAAGTETYADGARVSGWAEDPAHPDTPFRSTVVTTDENGEFTLTFPPQASAYSVRAGPNPGVNDLIPEVVFDVEPIDGDFGDLSLGIDFEQPINAVVSDENGNPVRDATVLFEGSVGELGGLFVTSGSSDDRGNVVTSEGDPLDLLPGDYRVTVAPQKSQPYALVSEVATIPNGDLQVTVRNKVRLAGCVREFDTVTPVPDAEVTVTRRDSPIPRVFRTDTGSNGCYEVRVDPGTADADAEYEVTVKPGADTGLPFFRELIVVGENDILTHDIDLYEPELVYGMVRDPNGMPLANVIIAFYSLELGLSADEPVLVGVVSTLDGIRAGEFVLPVPVPRED